MQDSVPPHSTNAVQEHSASCSGSRWPKVARSPNLNPLALYVCGREKKLVYSSPMFMAIEVQHRLFSAAEVAQTAMGNFRIIRRNQVRMKLCLRENGRHIEYLP